MVNFLTSANHAASIGAAARHSPSDLEEFTGAMQLFHRTYTPLRQRIGEISAALVTGERSDPRPIARELSDAINVVAKILPALIHAPPSPEFREAVLSGKLTAPMEKLSDLSAQLHATNAATGFIATPEEPKAEKPPRRGRLTNEESDAKRTAMLAMIRQHPSLKDDCDLLAGKIGVAAQTVRRWISEEEDKFLKTRAGRDAGNDD